MKPLLMILLAVLSCAGARAQYTNRFHLGFMFMKLEGRNGDGSLTMSPLATKPFRFGIYIGATNASEENLELVCVFTNITPFPAVRGGKVDELSFVTTNYVPVTNVSVQVRGWPIELGASYEEAWAKDTARQGTFGRTTVGTVTLVPYVAPSPTLFGMRGKPLDTLIMRPRSP
jgi:hypothetical protein